MLDVGSGSTIFPLYVRKVVGCAVTCVDMDSKLLRLKTYAQKMGLGAALTDGTLDIRVTESPKLTFEDNTFDGIACISTIEHSPGDSDLQTMLELVRVTKPGGILAFSVPIAKEHIDVFVKDRVYNREYSGEPVFYEHQYDRKTLFSRLIEPSGCEVVALQAFGETGYSFGKNVVYSKVLKIGSLLQPLRWTLPWIVKKFYKPIEMENCPERSFVCFSLRKTQ